MLDKKVKIKSIRNLGSNNYLLTVSSAEQARLIRPGQFVMLKCVEDVNENPLLPDKVPWGLSRRTTICGGFAGANERILRNQ